MDDPNKNEPQKPIEEPSEDYEVGYRKPPKHSRFPKGVSGNPKGRPKVALDFNATLLRQSKTLVTITENGKRKRVPKADVIVMQFIHNAMKGKTSDLRLYRESYQGACQEAALSTLAAPNHGTDVRDMTDEQLDALILRHQESQNGKKEE